MKEIKKNSDFLSMEQFDKKYAYKVVAIFLILVLLFMFIEGMLTLSLSTIGSDFGITIAQASLILSMYMVSGVALTPIIGKLGDIYGKKKMLIITLIIYTFAVVMTGFSPTFIFMVVSRTIQGVGLAVVPLGLSFIREDFPKEIVPKAQAIVTAMVGAGFGIGIPLGALVLDKFGWRWGYYFAIPIIISLVVISAIIIRESKFRQSNVKIDYVGAILLASSLSMFVFVITELGMEGRVSIYTFILQFGGIATLIPLLWYEFKYSRKGGEGILNFNLLSKRNVLIANIVIAILGLGLFLSLQALAYRFLYSFEMSILDTGLSIFPFAIGTFIFGPVAGVLVTKTGIKPISICGGLLAASGFLLIATLPSYDGVLLYEFIIGSGISLLNATIINFVVLTVKPKDIGLAIAMNTTFRNFGNSIGTSLAGYLLTTYATKYILPGGKKILIPKDIAFIYLFNLAAIAFIVITILIPFGKEVLKRKKKKRSNNQNNVNSQNLIERY